MYVDELRRRLRNDGRIVPNSAGMMDGKILLAHALPVANQRRTMWLPLGYHPWWCRIMNRAVQRANRDSALQSLVCYAFSGKGTHVRVAWRNFLPSNNALLRR